MLPTMQHKLEQNHLKKVWLILSIGFLVALISAGLAACGSSTSSGSPGNPSPTPPPQAQKCGSVQGNPRNLTGSGPDAKQAENCFWQAYQKCQAASLSYTLTGVDTIIKHTFTINKNGQQCSVSDMVQHAVVPAPLSAAKTYTCTGVVQQADGLHISNCGIDGTILIPAQPGA